MFRASKIRSFVKKPARNGRPISAADPMVIQDVVRGRLLFKQLNFRMSCSLFILWIILPEHKKSIALKKACVHMWRKAM